MCFSLGWIEHLLVNIVIIVAMVMILRLIVPWLLSLLGIDGGVIMRVIEIIIWAIVVIFLIYLAFSLLNCVGGWPSLSPHR